MSDAVGVLMLGGHTGGLTNSSLIQVGGTLSTTDSDGDGVDLHVSARQSSRSTGFAGLVTVTRYGDNDSWWGPQVTLGYHEIGQAEAGSTTAKFLSGTDPFSLLADEIKGGGMVARVALKGETTGGAFAAEGGAETRDSISIYDLRLAARFRS